MTDNKIEENAENWVSPMRKVPSCDSDTIALVKSAYIYGAHSRDEEIEELKNEASAIMDEASALKIQLDKLRNPWITDRDPEIKGSISDSVLLLIDGLFYRVSRLERRKDGSEYWWGVDSEKEVTAWMPIPELEEGE